jgi:hypothetical protein
MFLKSELSLKVLCSCWNTFGVSGLKEFEKRALDRVYTLFSALAMGVTHVGPGIKLEGFFGLWRIENPRNRLNKDVNRTSGGKFLCLLLVVVSPLYTCIFHSYTCACVVVVTLLLSIVIRVIALFLWLG